MYYPGPRLAPEFRPALPTLLEAGFGGTIVTIDLGSRARAEAFIKESGRSIPFAPSLGDVQTTLSHPATTSHRGQDESELARQGMTAGMVRDLGGPGGARGSVAEFGAVPWDSCGRTSIRR